MYIYQRLKSTIEYSMELEDVRNLSLKIAFNVPKRYMNFSTYLISAKVLKERKKILYTNVHMYFICKYIH